MIFNKKGRAPDFIIIGAQKSGTSSLFEDIMQHPELSRPIKKELHFFDNGYSQGLTTYYNYFSRSVFKNKNLISGEATPYYFFHPLAPERISQSLNEVKLILILRDPISRAISHYRMNRMRRIEQRTFAEAIEFENDKIEEEEKKLINKEIRRSDIHQNYSYLNRGLYAKQLKRWFSFFDKSSILILLFEEYINNQTLEFKKVTSFLNVAEVAVKASFLNRSESNTMILDDDLVEKLQEFYRSANKELFHIIDKENIWGF